MRYVLLLAVLSVAGCAQAEINEDAKFASSSFSDVAEYKALSNLSALVKRPWAPPSFVALNTGTLQATHTAGFNLSVPLTHALTGATVSVASSTFNLTPAQTADQASYSAQFVQDPDDLLRLNALYHYALCPDIRELGKEWTAASGQGPLNPYARDAFAAAEAANPKSTPKQIKKLALDASTAETAYTKLVNEEKEAKAAPHDRALIKSQAKTLTAAAARKRIAENKLASAVAGTGQGAGPGGGPNSDQASKIDTLENERRHLGAIADTLTPYQHWIWPAMNGVIYDACHDGSVPTPGAISVGTYDGVTFYAEPQKLQRFVILLNYAVPNTLGTVFLNDKNALVGQPPQKPQTFQLIGTP